MIALYWAQTPHALAQSIASQTTFTPDKESFTPEKYKTAERHQNLTILTEGLGADRSYAFIPDSPKNQKLPLVIFLHGWMGTNPKNYGALIDHLVRRGSVVIYPVYQVDGNTAPQSITQTAGKSIQRLLERLSKEQPDLLDTSKTLYYGFSMGATMAANFAIDAQAYALPSPRGLVLAAPGDAHHVAHGPLAQSILIKPIDQLPANIPVVLLSGSEDVTIGVPTAYKYWNALCSQQRLKTLILWPPGKSDHEQIGAGHGAPGAPDERYDFPDINATPPTSMPRLEQFPVSKSMNNLDYYGQWKVLSAWLDHLQHNAPIEWLFKTNHVVKDLGKFENGQPYPQAHIETNCPSHWSAPVKEPVKKTKAKRARSK